MSSCTASNAPCLYSSGYVPAAFKLSQWLWALAVWFYSPGWNPTYLASHKAAPDKPNAYGHASNFTEFQSLELAVWS